MDTAIPRAMRYAMTAPIRYRVAGSRDWNAGMTLNISRSGVLFTSEGEILPGAVIDMWLALPPAFDNTQGAELVSTGVVVRGDPAAGAPQFAARFHHYSLGRSFHWMEISADKTKLDS